MNVQVASCGRKYCGTVVAAHGDALDDARAGGIDRLVGARVLRDYAAAADGTWHGRVFVPELRRTLRSTIRFVDADTVQVSGCAVGGLICRTKLWHRLAPPQETAATREHD